MIDPLEPIGWPASRLGEALEALARRSGLSFNRGNPPALPKLPEPPGKALAPWVEAAARALGVEAEPFTCPYPEVEPSLIRAGPALLRLRGGAGPCYLALLGRRRRRLAVLTPGLEVAYLDPARVGSVLGHAAEATAAVMVDPVLAAAEVPTERRSRARAALLREMLGPHPIDAGWVLRSSPAAPLRVQAREFGLGRDLGRFLAGHVACCGLWVASWWLLGAAVLHGRADPGWLLAWALILLALIPCRILTSYAGGTLAVRAGLLLKRRLLFGALKLDPDQVRLLGSGQLLGRVLESEVLDTMALTGGFLTAAALIELGFAALILGAGAGGIGHILVLAAALLAAAFLARRQLRCRRRWTEQRLEMTHDLVEKMIGHRTRLAQEPPDDWHAGEDEALERYHDLSRELDRTNEYFQGLLPRGWLLAGTLALAPVFVFGQPSTVSLAIALGGLLAAYQAFRRLGEGIDRLTAAVVAWARVQPFWQTAAAEEPLPTTGLPTPAAVSPGQRLLEARDLAFQYPRRPAPSLAGLRLEIRQGDRVLLQGASGGGKSTLAAVLAGLREPDAGLLLLAGLDRQTLGGPAWRRRVVLTPQFNQNHVLLGSLAFNLLMGRGWPPRPEDLDEAERLCRALGLGPLLERMPAGLHQSVGETGWQLSHGERSRVFLARALLQGGDVLILDESFDSLDPGTLRTTLDGVLRHAPTLMLIAHP